MEKRFQVFISSTYRDLHEERQEIIRALLELDCIPAGMELFPAADDDAWTLIKRVIDESDYYLVVSAGRYGSMHPVTGIGYTEMEYDYAVSQGKPVIAFLHHDLKSLPVEKCDTDSEIKKKLMDFREKMRKKVIKEYSSSEVLAGVASRSIVQLIKQKPGVGWIRADREPDPRLETEIAQLRLKLSERERELETLRKEQSRKISGHTSPLHGLKGLDRAIDYITTRMGEDNVLSTIYTIFEFLHNSKDQRNYIKVGIAVHYLSASLEVDRELMSDILHCLSSGGAIYIDSDDDIALDSRIATMFREMRLRKNLVQEKGARSRDSTT